MNVNELYAYLNSKIPPELSLDWDNDGLAVCPDGEKTVKRVLVTMDVNLDAIKYAKQNNFDVIVSHHPLLFSGLKAVNQSTVSGRRVIELMNSGIACMNFHTRLDIVEGGVNDVLAEALGLHDTTVFGREQVGRVGNLESEMTLEEFAKLVKAVLGVSAVVCAGNSPVRRVALIGGSGDYTEADEAFSAGADTFLSGEFKYHMLADAEDSGRNYVMTGHFYSEKLVCGALESMIKQAQPTDNIYVETEFFHNVRVI